MRLPAALLLSLALSVPALAQGPASGPPPVTDKDRAAIEATAFDYLDGQLEGDPARVARSLHPDLAKRAVKPKATDELMPLRRMSKDELVQLTAQGVLKTPRDQWDRSVRILDAYGNVASVRVETPWFVDYFQMGRFGDRWVIVNAMYQPKKGG